MLVTLGQACPKQAHMARLNSSVETVGLGGGDLGCHKTAAKILGLTQLARIGFAYSIQSDYLWQL